MMLALFRCYLLQSGVIRHSTLINVAPTLTVFVEKLIFGNSCTIAVLFKPVRSDI